MSENEKKRSCAAFLRNALILVVLSPFALWSVGAIVNGGGFGPSPGGVRLGTVGALALFLLAVLVKLSFERFLLVLAVLCVAVTGWFTTLEPSHDRDWAPDQAVLPTAEIDGPLVTIRNIRNFEYASETEWKEQYYDETFDTREIEQAYFIVVPFAKELPGLAHTMVSFRFKGEKYIALSVEIRKEKGESYHPLRGLYKQYEVMYVAGDERDVIALRALHQKCDVYVHPGIARGEDVAVSFLDMVKRMNVIAENPEFYDTLTNNCTTNLVDHHDNVRKKPLPFDYRLVLPGYSDELVHELGLIDTDVDYEETRKRNLINERAIAADGREDFSSAIRGREASTPDASAIDG